MVLLGLARVKMPNLRDVDTLRARSVKRLADYVHEILKVRGESSNVVTVAFTYRKSVNFECDCLSEFHQPPQRTPSTTVQPRSRGPLPCSPGMTLFAYEAVTILNDI